MAKKFVFPSFYEGFGFPILEAMAVGTSIITSTKSSLPEIVADRATLINPYYPQTIARALTQKNTNKNDPKRAAEFSWNDSAQKFLQIISA